MHERQLDALLRHSNSTGFDAANVRWSSAADRKADCNSRRVRFARADAVNSTLYAHHSLVHGSHMLVLT